MTEDNSIYVIAGLTENYRGRIYDSAIVISPSGDIIGKHRKINLLDIEQPIYSVGKSLELISTSFSKIGVAICADNFKDSLMLTSSLAMMGAQIIL